MSEPGSPEGRKSSDSTEVHRAVAEAFIKGLGTERVKYEEASQSNDGTVWITVRGDEQELGGPVSNHNVEIDRFKGHFRGKYENAFKSLPAGTEIVLKLFQTPDARTYLTLYM